MDLASKGQYKGSGGEINTKPMDEDDGKKIKTYYNENMKESDRKLKVPIYKYKQRHDKYMITEVFLDAA